MKVEKYKGDKTWEERKIRWLLERKAWEERSKGKIAIIRKKFIRVNGGNVMDEEA